MMIKNWFWITLLLSFFALGSALIAEYIFLLEPCSMCLKQRHPYYFIIVLFIIFYFVNRLPNIFYFAGVQLASIYGLFYSIWHVGIEQKILKGPASCAAGIDLTTSVKNLKDQILSKSIINCEEVVWSFFGISAATLNTVFLFLIFTLNILYIYKYYDSKKIKKN